MIVPINSQVNPLPGITLYTSQGIPFIIDASALNLVNQFSWHVRKSAARNYVWRKIIRAGRCKYIALHRWLTHCPKHMEVHHVNGNTLDNRRVNLEITTRQAHNNLRIFRRNTQATDGSPTKKRKHTNTPVLTRCVLRTHPCT